MEYIEVGARTAMLGMLGGGWGAVTCWGMVEVRDDFDGHHAVSEGERVRA
jgi:hypothetical protein